jgi:hypothetical protein
MRVSVSDTNDVLVASDWLGLISTMAATFVGAFLAFLTARWLDKDREGKLHSSLRGALLAEVESSALLATTYIQAGVLAPAYRFSTAVYEAGFPQMIASGAMKPSDVKAVLDFYSQVRQINWLLDEIHRHTQGQFVDSRAEKERARLIAKLEEMRKPGARFYDPVMGALRSPSAVTGMT